MTQDSDTLALQGGLDLVTPAMMVKKGMCISAQNYEVEARGYRRCTGNERFDGQPKPSEARYFILTFDTGSVPIDAGDVVVGATSGAMAIALYDAIVDSGSFAGGDAAGSLILYNLTGQFEIAEVLEVSASAVAAATSPATMSAAAEDELNAIYLQAAIDARRAVIAKPPGSGPVRGVATFNGDKYCWRDNAGGTACAMFKATSTGWQEVVGGSFIRFAAGVTAFVEGEVLTGGTSGATATIERVVRNEGAWDGGAEGYLVLSGVTGVFVDTEALTSATGAATAASAAQAITFPAGGLYRSIETNFFATAGFKRLYFVNGVGPACEFDGDVIAPIYTGRPDVTEKPQHIAEHRLHLFLGYKGGSLQNSSTGMPLEFDAVTGAAEIGFGQDITGLRSNTRDSLIITGRNKLGYLVGTDATNFDLRSVSEDSGAIENTLEIVGSPLFLDDQGVRDMQAAETYGDWKIGTKTQKVEPLLRQRRETGQRPVGSMRVRSKDQYRLYFPDGSGILIYLGRREPEIMTVSLGFAPFCFHSGENEDGDEVLFAGSVDGMVYQIDVGTSFDGEPILAFLRLSFMNQGAPNIEKRYHRARVEGQASESNTNLSAVADFSYGDANQPPSNNTDFVFFGDGGFWNEAIWDQFQWSSAIEGQAFADLDGIGENVSLVFASESATKTPHTLSTLTINFTRRRKLR